MKYSTSILATVVACAYMGQARTIGQTKATEDPKEKGIMNMDFDEGYGPYNNGYGTEDNYYFYPARGIERGYVYEEEEERPYGRYESRYPEESHWRKDDLCGCERERYNSGCGNWDGVKHYQGCERSGHGYGFEEDIFPYGEHIREYNGGRYGSSGYDGNDDYEVGAYGGGYEHEGGKYSRRFGADDYGFGYEDEDFSYHPYGEEDYEVGYGFSGGYPRGKRPRGARYYESERERERESRKEREERERKDFQKYKDIDAQKKEFEVEDDKRFLELGYGYDRGIKYNKGYGYTKSFKAEHEDRFDDARFNREDAERKDYRDAREFEHYSNPREAERRRYYESRPGRYFTA